MKLLKPLKMMALIIKIFTSWFGDKALKAIKDDGTYDKMFATWSCREIIN